MADVAENATYADAATAISQGKRHLLVQDYTAAVTAFAEGLEMMSQKLGDCDDELGEPYLLYGRALLGLAREEAGVLGGGVPGSEEAEDDEDGEEEDGEDEKMSDVEEKDEESEETEEKKKPTTEPSVEETAADKKTETEAKKEEKVEEKVEKQPEKEEKPTSNATDDKKIEEQKLEKVPDKVKGDSAESAEEGKKSEESNPKPEAESVAGSSKVHTNGSASSAEKSCNGTAAAAGKSNEGEDDDEDVNKEDDEEDPGRGTDLQVAWEVLELAKIVFAKRGEAGLKNLAETHRLLGEVAMESDNPQGAITDLEGALDLLQKMEPREARAIAELHYQLGLAHSMLNHFAASIEQFNEATTLLKARIKQLQDTKEPPKSDDPFYTVEGEIKEIEELLPAIQEKITDMKEYKDEAYRLVIKGINDKVAGGCTNGAAGSSSSDGASSSSQPVVSPKNAKPASDISHLVRKKRKAEDPESPAQSPCKKPTP